MAGRDWVLPAQNGDSFDVLVFWAQNGESSVERGA
ncbi:hypothetical protein HDA44_004073 [Kribbella solani]|uniref:Uncharacterized protein n=1 Tax=Kribbella solani TaxID=236067 RepID=A0A841DQ82_9ACTN|nr:hypothetical protein [Kribbella solani]